MNTLVFSQPTFSPSMSMTEVSPRLMNRKLNIVRLAVQVVKKQTGYVSNADVAAYLGISLEEYNHILQDANSYRLFNTQQEVA